MMEEKDRQVSVPVLVPIAQQDVENIFIKFKEFRVGRSLSNHFVINLPFISREHVMFEWLDSHSFWSIRNLSSSTIKINEEDVDPKTQYLPLKHNDIITMYDNLKYKFHMPKTIVPEIVANQTPFEKKAKEDLQLIITLECKLAQAVTDKNRIMSQLETVKKQRSDDREKLLESNDRAKIFESECERLEKIVNALEEKLKQKKVGTMEDNDSNLLMLCTARAEYDMEEEKIKSIINDIISIGTNNNGLKNKLLQVQKGFEMLSAKRTEIFSGCSAQISNDDSIQKSLLGLLENDFQCSICNELFVKATTLNCTHTFCRACINRWRQQKHNCPFCRVTTSKMIHNINIDNFIENVLSKYYPEKKKLYLEIKSTHEATTSNNVPSRKRSRPIVISDDLTNSTDPSDDSEWEDMADDYDEVHIIPYYGGYGHCFVCGSPDHWANSCPRRYQRPS